jgi:hypothetical protein
MPIGHGQGWLGPKYETVGMAKVISSYHHRDLYMWPWPDYESYEYFNSILQSAQKAIGGHSFLGAVNKILLC